MGDGQKIVGGEPGGELARQSLPAHEHRFRGSRALPGDKRQKPVSRTPLHGYLGPDTPYTIRTPWKSLLVY